MLGWLRMSRRHLLAGFFVGAILIYQGALCAQGNLPRVSVNEAKAVAVLAADSIRLQLPIDHSAGIGVQAVAWVMSPTGTRSGETTVELAEGERTASLTLPWPRRKESAGN